MYETFYRLKGSPFQLSPDPRFLYSSKGHSRAMAYLVYGAHQAEGFIIITGEIGAGKTTLARALARKLDAQKVVLAEVVSTQVGADDMLRMVASAFGLPHHDSKAVLLRAIEKFLLSCHKQGKRALLLVDEAQNLPVGAVEELRMLSNFQYEEKSLLQSFLLGQPEFRRTIQKPEMEQLLQRVIAACHLGPMDAAETKAYILHRLRTVGWAGDPAIDDEAFAAIYRQTGGIPRRINILCNRLLLLGYMDEKHEISGNDVAIVIDDMVQEFAPIDMQPDARTSADDGTRRPARAGAGADGSGNS